MGAWSDLGDGCCRVQQLWRCVVDGQGVEVPYVPIHSRLLQEGEPMVVSMIECNASIVSARTIPRERNLKI